MIHITESSIGIWYISLPGADWLGHLSRATDGRLEFVRRTRTYVDERVFDDSADDKVWYMVKAKRPDHPISDMLRTIRRVVDGLILDQPKACTWELIRGERSFDEFTELLCHMPSVHHVVHAADDHP